MQQNPEKSLTSGDERQDPPFFLEDNPYLLFQDWFSLAEKNEPSDPNAMALATLNSLNFPEVRIVLLKGFSEEGFQFFTNYESQKAQDLQTHPRAALNFYWKSIERQIRIQGHVEKLSPEGSDAYFQTRPRESQLGAWASLQSRPLENRKTFEERLAHFEEKFANKPVPRPEHWGGFIVKPLSLEFWQAHPYRWHDRLLFSRPHIQAKFSKQRLYP